MVLFQKLLWSVFFLATNLFYNTASASVVVEMGSLNPHLDAIQQDQSIPSGARDLRFVGVLLRTDRTGRVLPRGQLNNHSPLIAQYLSSLRSVLEAQPTEVLRLKSIGSILRIAHDWAPTAGGVSYYEVTKDLNEGLILHKILFAIFHSMTQPTTATMTEDMVATIAHLNGLAQGSNIVQRVRKPGDIWSEYLNFEVEIRAQASGGSLNSAVQAAHLAIQRASLEAIQDAHVETAHTSELRRLIDLLRSLSPLEWVELQMRLEDIVKLQRRTFVRQEVVLSHAALVWHDVLLRNDRSLSHSARDWQLMGAQALVFRHEEFVMRMAEALRSPERRRWRDWMGFDLMNWIHRMSRLDLEGVPVSELVSLSRPFEMRDSEVRALAKAVRGLNHSGCEAILQEVTNSPSFTW